MDEIEQRNNTQIKFYGTGGEYFGILVLNILLTIITLGIYYPWAKTKSRKFFTSNTYFADSPLSYHGTGTELFKGFIVVVLFIILYNIINFVVESTGNTYIINIYGMLSMLFIFTLIPLSIHGSMKYRASRTSWRNIFFTYDGDRREFVILFLKSILFFIITFGFYFSWAEVNISKYIIEKHGLGNVKTSFTGKGGDLFMIHLAGLILTIFTFGIYSFWYTKNIYNYYINNTFLHQGEKTIAIDSSISGGGIFSLSFINMLLIIFSFGIAIPWVIIRTMNFYIDNIYIEENLNPDEIIQGEIASRVNSIGDGMVDALDIGF
ncbi:MAG: DUF898 domain-containing protein [Sphingobacteriales bacterium]|jgi:uncharacterized membrane protein YjgN (DUF898 family)|nr:MAG: DUF898 domain-containing protein [Sphingobacteriales bacterium]